ncbi:DUF6380 family protein [Streptomyces sp. NBC_00989]
MDKVGQGDAAGEMRHATLRCEAASLTATTCHGGYAGGSAR